MWLPVSDVVSVDDPVSVALTTITWLVSVSLFTVVVDVVSW